MTEEESRPLFSKDLRNRMAEYLKNMNAVHNKAGLVNVQAGINLILEALLEM